MTRAGTAAAAQQHPSTETDVLEPAFGTNIDSEVVVDDGDVAVATTTTITSTSQEFIIRTKYEEYRRSVYKTWMPIWTVVLCLLYVDIEFYHVYWWLVGLIIIVVILLETSPIKDTVEVVVTVYPLLNIIQLSTWKNDRPVGGNPTVVPIDTILDCIVHEYVGAFQVTTHVMFRLTTTMTGVQYQPQKQHAKEGEEETKLIPSSSTTATTKTTTKLVQAFPGITQLTFLQCLEMKNQIQSALNKVKQFHKTEVEEEFFGDSTRLKKTQ